MKITNVSVRNCTQILDGLARTCVIKVIVAEFFIIFFFIIMVVAAAALCF